MTRKPTAGVGNVIWRAMGASEALAFTSAQMALAFRWGEYIIEGASLTALWSMLNLWECNAGLPRRCILLLIFLEREDRPNRAEALKVTCCTFIDTGTDHGSLMGTAAKKWKDRGRRPHVRKPPKTD